MFCYRIFIKSYIISSEIDCKFKLLWVKQYKFNEQQGVPVGHIIELSLGFIQTLVAGWHAAVPESLAHGWVLFSIGKLRSELW